MAGIDRSLAAFDAAVEKRAGRRGPHLVPPVQAGRGRRRLPGRRPAQVGAGRRRRVDRRLARACCSSSSRPCTQVGSGLAHRGVPRRAAGDVGQQVHAATGAGRLEPASGTRTAPSSARRCAASTCGWRCRTAASTRRPWTSCPAASTTSCPTGTDTPFDWAVGPTQVEAAAGDAGILRPEFAPGDVLLFDHLFLHRTAAEPVMTAERHAIESWFFAPSTYPDGQIPILF